MTAPPPDLSSILQTLSSYTAQYPQAQLSHAQPAPDESYDPSYYDPALTSHLQNTPSLPPHQQYQYHTLQPDPSSQSSSIYHSAPETLNATIPAPSHQKSSTPIPTASSHPPPTTQITTYASALRHITTHLIPLPHFKPRVQHLISTQHKHERQWHSGRQNLLSQLAGRQSSRAKLDAVLSSIGGGTAFAGASASTSAGEGKGKVDSTTGELGKGEELAIYDRKVWRAQRDMVAAVERELDKLGVPFFEAGAANKWVGKEDLLKELKGRVLGLLDDLCGEEEV